MRRTARGLSSLVAIPLLAITAPVNTLSATPLMAGDPLPEELWADKRVNESFWDFAVSLGNNGTATFSDTGFDSTYSRLYSSSLGTTAVPIWQRSLSGTPSFVRSVDSADFADLHAVVRHQGPTTSERRTRLEVFRSSSSSPVFTHIFDELNSGTGNNWCYVNEAGTSVIAAFISSNSTHVKRFDADTSSAGFSPQGDWTLPTLGKATSVQISADLRTMYLGTNSIGRVFELTSAGATQLLDQWFIGGASTEGHALSADGRMIAVPFQERVELFTRVGATFVLTGTMAAYPLGSPFVARRAVLSKDRRILAVAYYHSTTQRQVSVDAWNLETGNHILHDTLIGQYQNYPQDLVISEDGRRLAVAFSGVETNKVPGIRVYELLGQNPNYSILSSFYRPGSVVDLDISPDGNRLAAAEKAIPLNQGYGDKIIEAIDLGKDFALNGVPRQGRNVTLEFFPESGGANTPCLLLKCSESSIPPLFFDGIGSLYLERSLLTSEMMGSTDSTGKASFLLNVSGPVGSTLYYQGLRLNPRLLSRSWVPVTVLQP